MLIIHYFIIFGVPSINRRNFMKIAIYGRPFNKNIIPFIQDLSDTLKRSSIEWIIHEPLWDYISTGQNADVKTFSTHDEIRNEKVEFLFSIGGDGTLLDTLSLVRDSGIPVLGINTGRLGFLSSISRDNFEKAIEFILQGHFSLDKRALLRLETNKPLFGDVSYALNELTVHKRDSSSMITINTFLNGEFLNSYWADGLIIATPTGSTGYSLSCGGPILVPQSENFVITPIAPHNLNVRPVVVSDKTIISLEIEGRGQYFLATLDARSVSIDPSVKIAVRKESFGINLVRLNNENFPGTLRNKLMWGLDTRN